VSKAAMIAEKHQKTVKQAKSGNPGRVKKIELFFLQQLAPKSR